MYDARIKPRKVQGEYNQMVFERHIFHLVRSSGF